MPGAFDYDICIIGGGAAGFFAAIQAAETGPGLRIAIVEKTDKLLSKVKVSGGGRCNVTHHCFDAQKLAAGYPRGGSFLLPLFRRFGVKETVSWFETRGVRLKTEDDGRMFPATDSSQTIIDLFQRLVRKYHIEIREKTGIEKLERTKDGFILHSTAGTITCKKLIICTGGSPKESGLLWLSQLGIKIQTPCPSLFTFNLPAHAIRQLAGISVEDATVSLCGTPFQQKGPVLVTHWGLSGPAIIKLSAWQARELNACGYNFEVKVNWLGSKSKSDVIETLKKFAVANPKKHIRSVSPFPQIPHRLWQYFAEGLIGTGPRNWAESGKKTYEGFADILCLYNVQVSGKTTFKEEFVTCGGVDLDGVNPETMESTVLPGCYFSGEILDIDGITGGFNFQSAWTTSTIAANAAVKSLGKEK